MKLNIHYDLIDKIYEAKGQYKLKKYYKNDPVTSITWFIISPAINFGTAAMKIQSINDAISNSTACIIAAGILIPTLDFLGEKLYEKIYNKTIEEKAMDDLRKLSSQLNQLNVKTSGELLLDSKVYHKQHKFVLSEKGIPGIMQNKYINIPTYDNGDIKETSILQEHKIGTKEYVLSLGSPTKRQVFKLAYGM